MQPSSSGTKMSTPSKWAIMTTLTGALRISRLSSLCRHSPRKKETRRPPNLTRLKVLLLLIGAPIMWSSPSKIRAIAAPAGPSPQSRQWRVATRSMVANLLNSPSSSLSTATPPASVAAVACNHVPSNITRKMMPSGPLITHTLDVMAVAKLQVTKELVCIQRDLRMLHGTTRTP